MSEQELVHTATQPKPVPEGYTTWNDYWTKAHNQPWRTEAEIEEERQQYLAERRAIEPDIEKGIYPFKDIKLDRADVEWLLTTHASGQGPIDWDDEKQRARDGVDLRGADCRSQRLSGLPLARVRAGLNLIQWFHANPQQREWAAAHFDDAKLVMTQMQRSELGSATLPSADIRNAILRQAFCAGANFDAANLTEAILVGADLRNARLQRAEMSGVRLEGAFVRYANLIQANLRTAVFDGDTTLADTALADKTGIGAQVADARWGDTDIMRLSWEHVKMLGDEAIARDLHTHAGKAKGRSRRNGEYAVAVRANRQIAAVLRDRGLAEVADRFAYNAQGLQRTLWRRQRHYLRYVGSLLLWLVSGYGYRPIRSLITYLVVIIAFAATYFALGAASGQTLSWNEAIVISMTAFHGRGFFSAVFQPGDLQAAVAAVEAFIGLLIEIVFIATFTQRFFAR